MRRGQRRASRSERIIHGIEGGAAASPDIARTRVPRGQAKIRSLDEGDRSAVLQFEESLRRNWAADAGVGVGADVAEAAAALSARRRGKAERRPLPPAAKAPAPAAKRAFSLASLPKPLRHLLAGAFSGGARSSWAARACEPRATEYCL